MALVCTVFAQVTRSNLTVCFGFGLDAWQRDNLFVIYWICAVHFSLRFIGVWSWKNARRVSYIKMKFCYWYIITHILVMVTIQNRLQAVLAGKQAMILSEYHHWTHFFSSSICLLFGGGEGGQVFWMPHLGRLFRSWNLRATFPSDNCGDFSGFTEVSFLQSWPKTKEKIMKKKLDQVESEVWDWVWETQAYMLWHVTQRSCHRLYHSLAYRPTFAIDDS